MADLSRLLETAALAEEQDALGHSSRQQVHDGCSVGCPDPKVDDGQAFAVARRLHRAVNPPDLALESVGERIDVLLEIGQEYVVSELVDSHPRVPRQPVLDNEVLACLRVSTHDRNLTVPSAQVATASISPSGASDPGSLNAGSR